MAKGNHQWFSRGNEVNWYSFETADHISFEKAKLSKILTFTKRVIQMSLKCVVSSLTSHPVNVTFLRFNLYTLSLKMREEKIERKTINITRICWSYCNEWLLLCKRLKLWNYFEVQFVRSTKLNSLNFNVYGYLISFHWVLIIIHAWCLLQLRNHFKSYIFNMNAWMEMRNVMIWSKSNICFIKYWLFHLVARMKSESRSVFITLLFCMEWNWSV